MKTLNRCKLHTRWFTVLTCALLCGFALAGCHSSEDDQLDEYGFSSNEKANYKKTKSLLEEAASTLKSYKLTHEDADLMRLTEEYNALVFSYEDGGLTDEGRKLCAAHKYSVDSLRKAIGGVIEKNLGSARRTLVAEDDHLIECQQEFAFYMPKGTTMYLDFETAGPTDIKLVNADSRATIRTWIKKQQYHDSVQIANGAIYLLEVTPKTAQYINLKVRRNCLSLEDFSKEYNVVEEETECTARDFRARKVQGIRTANIFEEPRKVTLRSQGKALFSGGSRSVVAMTIPAGCTDIAYSLRISTSQEDKGSDGEFCNKFNEKYRKIKFLGLPLYESSKQKSSLFRELLNSRSPDREEEAYCNMYVFTNSNEAKKFSEGTAVSSLKYNVDYSKQGTQSCNDRIPIKGVKTLYFGFENTRVRYSVYLWFESLGTVPTTEYFTKKYTLE